MLIENEIGNLEFTVINTEGRDERSMLPLNALYSRLPSRDRYVGT